jgi:outer membrane protein assembly factor BamB
MLMAHKNLVNVVTGKIRWRTERKIETASYSVPCVRKNEAGQDELVCCSTAEGIFALDPRNGHELWSAPGVFSMRTVSSPVLAGGLVFGTTGKGAGGNYVVAVRPGPAAKVAYEIRQQAPYVPTPVTRGEMMFLFEDRQGHVTCINVTDGKVLWRKERVAGAFYACPVRAGDKLFCVDEKGVVVCLAAGREFKELGRTDLAEECRSTPAIAGGRMYIRTVSHLISVGGKEPAAE